MVAVGFQMAIEVTRNFDMAIRWSVQVETMMISVQRLLAYAKLKPEEPVKNEEINEYLDEESTISGQKGSV